MAVQTGLAEYIGRFFEAPMRLLFGVPGACAPAFILGIIGGYPVGAKTALTLYQNRLCSKTEAERLLAFCNNCGPAFILGTVGSAVFGDMRVGILLYASHILASIAVGIIFRFYHRER
ncbi:MAG: sporulation protein, partial [Angelakisella sp.]